MRLAFALLSFFAGHLACAQSERAYAEALRLNAAGNVDAAVDALKRIIVSDPSFARAYYRLVEIQSDRAPELREWLRGLGTTYSCVGLIELARVRKEYPSGDAEARSCTANAPELLAVYKGWVTLASSWGHVEELASELARRSSSAPGSTAQQYAAGYAYSLAATSNPQYYDLARRYLERAAALAPESDEIDDAIFYLNQEKDPALAAAASRRLLDRARARGDEEWAYRAAGRLALSDLLLSDFSKALDEYTDALRGARELGRNIAAGEYIVNAGQCLFRLGRFEEAIAMFKEGLRNPNVESASTGWLSDTYRETANYAEALTYAEKAYQLARDSKQPRQIAFRATNLAFTWLNLGLPERALEATREAQSALEHDASTLWQGRVLVDVGNILTQLGRTQEAAATFARGIQLAVTNHDAIAESEARILRCQLLTDGGRFAEAAGELAAAENILATKPRHAQWKLAAARLALRQGHLTEAAAAFDDALQSASELPAPTLVWQCHAGLSDVFWQQGKLVDALRERQKAIDIIEVIRGSLISADQRAGFLAGRIKLYKDVTRLSLQLGDPVAAFESSERGRARALLDLKEDSAPGSSTNSELEQSIRELAAIRTRAPSPESLRNAELNLQTATDRYLVSLTNNGVHAVPSAVLPQVQRQLHPGTTLLYYSLDQPSSTLFVISHDRLRIYRLPSRSSIETQVRDMHSLLSASPSRLEQQRLFEQLQALYRVLIGPAAAALTGTRQIVVVPDGVLNYLPFEALVAPLDGQDFSDWSSLPYLIRRFELRYAPSATMAVHNAGGSRRTTPSTLLAYGDPQASSKPLPFSRLEIERLAAFYPAGKQRVVVGAAATKTAFKSDPALPESTILHLALHGTIDEHWPQMSGLVFSPAGAGDDGILRIYEILRMHLKAETVVLSACETSLGPAIEGEGLASVRRAFLMAGAKSIVASLWKVDDPATAELMVRFHSHLNRVGTNGSQALRAAELEMLSSKAYTHPHYWSAFGITGRAD
jgi:CHAT domain-containing protein